MDMDHSYVRKSSSKWPIATAAAQRGAMRCERLWSQLVKLPLFPAYQWSTGRRHPFRWLWFARCKNNWNARENRRTRTPGSQVNRSRRRDVSTIQSTTQAVPHRQAGTVNWYTERDRAVPGAIRVGNIGTRQTDQKIIYARRTQRVPIRTYSLINKSISVLRH